MGNPNFNLSPIVFFAYNRPDHTRKALESLLTDPLAAKSEIYMYSDAPKNPAQAAKVEEVRQYLRNLTGFQEKHLIERETNFGLEASIREGVNRAMAKNGSAIVIEDDLIIHPGFLAFLNQSLEKYRGDKTVFSISAWAPDIELPSDFQSPVYLSRRAFCWGWASWKDRWDSVDWEVSDFASFERDRAAQKSFDCGGDDMSDMLRNSMTGRVKSWAIRWCYSQFRHNRFAVVPKHSYVSNIGQDDSGENSLQEHQLPNAPLAGPEPLELPAKPPYDERIQQKLRDFYAYNWRAKVKKALGLL